MPRLLYVPVSAEALDRLVRRANEELRRPQDEAAILLEQALGLRPGPALTAAGEGAGGARAAR